MSTESTLLVDGALGLVTATAFAFTGRALQRRPVEGDARLAAAAFVAWWYAAAVLTALLAGLRLLAGAGALTPSLLATALYVGILPLCFGLACLVYYLGFAATGWRGLLAPVAVGYAAYYAFLVGYVAWSDPVGYGLAPWSLRIAYATTPGGWPFAVAVTLLFLPPLVALAGYARLYRHARSPTTRYRLALVTASVLVLLASGVVASEVGVPALDGAYPASRAAALAGALGILLAYAPPAWVRRRFSVQPVHQDLGDG